MMTGKTSSVQNALTADYLLIGFLLKKNKLSMSDFHYNLPGKKTFWQDDLIQEVVTAAADYIDQIRHGLYADTPKVQAVLGAAIDALRAENDGVIPEFECDHIKAQEIATEAGGRYCPDCDRYVEPLPIKSTDEK